MTCQRPFGFCPPRQNYAKSFPSLVGLIQCKSSKRGSIVLMLVAFCVLSLIYIWCESFYKQERNELATGDRYSPFFAPIWPQTLRSFKSWLIVSDGFSFLVNDVFVIIRFLLSRERPS